MLIENRVTKKSMVFLDNLDFTCTLDLVKTGVSLRETKPFRFTTKNAPLFNSR